MNNKYFLKKPYKIIKFKPELNNEYLNYYNISYKLKLIFPFKENIKNKDDLKNLKISRIGLHSISYINLGLKFVDIIKSKFKSLKDLTITDANGGNGGLCLHFIDKFKFTNIIEINKFHSDIIEHNLNVYGFNKNKYKIYNKDSLKYLFKLNQDIIIFDPPWGGENYMKNKNISLGFNNINIACIINKLIYKKKCKLILFLIPENFDFQTFLSLIKRKKIEIHTVSIRKNKKQYILSINCT